ncbi:hypothetical protein T10_12893 [Trichinella papuae]|uniref:Uncharacterized protein n=1 Tax=Trichinella papuae TaxID=268474 RepID=A0A0V1MXJ1_9BILA|nr:hypothetical protein T10_12893 [Trichinella papuae]
MAANASLRRASDSVSDTQMSQSSTRLFSTYFGATGGQNLRTLDLLSRDETGNGEETSVFGLEAIEKRDQSSSDESGRSHLTDSSEVRPE